MPSHEAWRFGLSLSSGSNPSVRPLVYWILLVGLPPLLNALATPTPLNPLASDAAIGISPSHPIFRAPNPKTTSGRPILLKPFDTTKKKNVWQTLLEEGGWMSHGRRIVPVFGGDEDATSSAAIPPDGWVGALPDGSEHPPAPSAWFFLEPTLDLVDADAGLSPPPLEFLPNLKELLWISKPSGLLTLPGKSEPDSLATRVNGFLEQEQQLEEALPSTTTTTASSESSTKHYNKASRSSDPPSEWIPRPCHRLDQDTSGIIAMAKTKAAYTALSKQFEERWVQKQYVALVHGIVAEESTNGTIDMPIGKLWDDDQGYHVWSTDPSADKARPAITDYMVSWRYNNSVVAATNKATSSRDLVNYDTSYTRMILQPRTGRGHQLRLHMKEMGHPIVGDTIHGGYDQQYPPPEYSPRLCLHAEYLQVWVRDSENQIYQAKCWCLPPF